MDPATAAAFLNAGSRVAGAALSDAPDQSRSSASQQNEVNSWLDGSAWTVSTGKSTANGSGGGSNLLALAGLAFLAWNAF